MECVIVKKVPGTCDFFLRPILCNVCMSYSVPVSHAMTIQVSTAQIAHIEWLFRIHNEKWVIYMNAWPWIPQMHWAPHFWPLFAQCTCECFHANPQYDLEPHISDTFISSWLMNAPFVYMMALTQPLINTEKFPSSNLSWIRIYAHANILLHADIYCSCLRVLCNNNV